MTSMFYVDCLPDDGEFIIVKAGIFKKITHQLVGFQ